MIFACYTGGAKSKLVKKGKTEINVPRRLRKFYIDSVQTVAKRCFKSRIQPINIFYVLPYAPTSDLSTGNIILSTPSGRR